MVRLVLAFSVRVVLWIQLFGLEWILHLIGPERCGLSSKADWGGAVRAQKKQFETGLKSWVQPASAVLFTPWPPRSKHLYHHRPASELRCPVLQPPPLTFSTTQRRPPSILSFSPCNTYTWPRPMHLRRRLAESSDRGSRLITRPSRSSWSKRSRR
jgi:hypothetical protein